LTKTISERLRAGSYAAESEAPGADGLMRLAADEIERLMRYVEALEFVADSHGLQAAQAMVRATDEPDATPPAASPETLP